MRHPNPQRTPAIRTRRWLRTMLCCGPMLACAAQAAQPEAPVFNEQEALKRSQSAIGRQLGEYHLQDRRGRPTTLADYRGKPVVISLIYTSCYHTCPMTTQQLARAVRKARQSLGADSFHVVSVGFDAPMDTPEAMAAFARQQGVDAENWDFLSGDEQTIARLTQDLGFTYRRSPKGFDHLIQTTVVDEQGRVYVQLYGELVNVPLLVEPLKQLALGKPAVQDGLHGLWEKVRLFCTIYDPGSDSYRFDYSIVLGIVIGAGILIGAGGYLVREMRRQRASRST